MEPITDWIINILGGQKTISLIKMVTPITITNQPKAGLSCSPEIFRLSITPNRSPEIAMLEKRERNNH